MLKSLLTIILLIANVSFACDRFTDADKNRFLQDVKNEIKEYKEEKKVQFMSVEMIRPGFHKGLGELFNQGKLLQEEVVIVKQSFEDNLAAKKYPVARVESEFYNLVQKELNNINCVKIVPAQLGEICNNRGCVGDLLCIEHSEQKGIDGKKAAGLACKWGKECASGSCDAGICESVEVCFKPVSPGQSCLNNPACINSKCEVHNIDFLGTKKPVGAQCANRDDCNSELCVNGVCQLNKLCKSCTGFGGIVNAAQACCAGLRKVEREDGTYQCINVAPPEVMNPSAQYSPKKSLIQKVLNFIIPDAKAADAAEADKAEADKAEESKPESDAAAIEGAKDDGKTLAGEILSDKDKYSNFTQESTEPTKTLNMNEKKAKVEFSRKSDFKTCTIEFKDDFYNAMKTDGNFDLEVAMLAFDFVITGDSDSDYWKGGKTADFETLGIAGISETVQKPAGNSLYERLKVVGIAHREKRKQLNKKLDEANTKLTCMCLDVQGYKNITNAEKKKFFETSCPAQYEKYNNPSTSADELEGDASGVKGKRLLTEWSKELRLFYAELTTENTATMKELSEISKWSYSEAQWSTAKSKNYELFKFNIKNPSGNIAALGAIISALLAAGVIAILGGFATTSILSAWGAAGIISASAVTGAGGLWMIATLKGAWITQGPQISDGVVAPRSYSCGKKETCMEYTRTLVQPYNDICKIHASSNACIKNFVIINDGNQSVYVVDPWIPVGVAKNDILSGQPNYAEKLEMGFVKAREAMVMKNPGASGGGGKKGGGEFVAETYLGDIFIDQNILGKYVPAIGSTIETDYFLTPAKIKIIKDAAKKFAISEGFIREGETKNLQEFADYAFTYHFIWPKRSRPDEISYPTVGLSTYLDYMAVSVSGNLSSSQSVVTAGLVDLNKKYAEDYKKTLELYAKNPTSQLDTNKKNLVNAEIDKINKELDSLMTMSSLLNNKGLDTDLSKLTGTFVADQSKLAGVSGSVAFNAADANFLKAVGTLRSARKDQLSKLSKYKKAVAASGDADRINRLAASSKKFKDNFTKGKSSGMGGAWGSGFGSGAGAAGGLAGSGDAAGTQDDSKSAYGATAGGAYGDGANSSPGALYGSSMGSSRSSSPASSGMGSGDDQRKISDAINARNANQGKYESTEGLTLFEKITNAYIRNYDKVLPKKKDKDVIEDKQ